MQQSNQSIASNPEFSVWVSASAGTGKTKVLTDRVLRLLLQGTPPNKILCITFTNAAAAEMFTRVNETLKKWVISSDSELKETIFNLIGKAPDTQSIKFARTLFPKTIDTENAINIHTIHSFCQYLLKRFPLEAGVSPHFSIMSEQESFEMVSESYKRLLTQPRKDKELEEAVNYLAKNVTNSSLNDIIDSVIRNRVSISASIEKHGIKSVYRLLETSREKSVNHIIKSLHQDSDKTGLHLVADALTEGTENDKARAQTIYQWIGSGDNFQEYYKIFLTTTGETKKISSVITKKPKEALPESENIILKEQSLLCIAAQEIKSHKTARLTESLSTISSSLLAIYEHLKRSMSVLDYDDLIQYSDFLLSDSTISPWVIYKLDGGIDYLLLDEAQDTSPEQWRIISSLCEEFFSGETSGNSMRRIFVVGDEKQSIFSFQGADPKEFNRMHNYFQSKASHVQHQWRTISLDKSFRSTEAILEVVDAVFSDPTLSKAINSSANKIEHIAHRSNHPGKVELWAIEEPTPIKSGKEDWIIPNQEVSRIGAKEALADKIVAEVEQWLSAGKTIERNGKMRAVSPGDIMILVRHRDDFVKSIVKKCKKREIKVAGVDRLNLPDYIAVMDLMALGNFVLLPNDDLNLATVLKTPFIGLNEESLFHLCYNRGGDSIWCTLKSKAEVEVKYKNILVYLESLLERSHNSPLDFYNFVLEVKEGKKSLVSRLGDEAIDPIDEFINSCIDYEKKHPPSLQGFISWFNLGKREVKRNIEKNDNAISVMTVHASKGLQSPIVILADTTTLPKTHENLLWHKNGQFLWPGNSSNYNKLCVSISEEGKRDKYEEYLRLLYVAMTRAEDELYICGAEGNRSAHEKSWYKIIENGISKLTTKEGDKYIVTSGNTNACTKKMNLAKNQPSVTFPKKFLKRPLTHHKNEPTKNINKKISINDSISKGNAVHKLLEILPSLDKNSREQIGYKILEKKFPSVEGKNQILDNVISIINNDKFTKIFSHNSFAEVEISGTVNDKILSARVDRLVINENKIIIIDYKSDSFPPPNSANIPVEYIQQMQNYRSIIEVMYPEKEIKTMLLWTENHELMEI